MASPEFGYTAIAWGLYYDGTGGLKMEVYRRLILIENYLAYGETDLGTGNFKWQVTKYSNLADAQTVAIDLTAISEKWGCTLVDEPHAREIQQHHSETKKWLDTISGGPDSHRGGLDATYRRTMTRGTPIRSTVQPVV